MSQQHTVMKSRKQLTRLVFLKRSGLIAGGLTFLPHSVLAAAEQSLETDEVSIRKLAEYQIIVPDQTNPVEQQAAEKLQQYVNVLVHTELALSSSEDPPPFDCRRDNSPRLGGLICFHSFYA